MLKRTQNLAGPASSGNHGTTSGRLRVSPRGLGLPVPVVTQDTLLHSSLAHLPTRPSALPAPAPPGILGDASG